MMPVFTIEYSEESLSQLKKLDKAVIKRIISKIESTKSNPGTFFKRLTGRPEYKLRIGDYRVIADIDYNRKTVFVRSVGHRKNVYE